MAPSPEPVIEVIETQTVSSSRFAGFWRRIGALLVDSAVLGVVGFPLGLLLGTFDPPLQNGCQPASAAGKAFVGVYPE